jgi:hypothetical protein
MRRGADVPYHNMARRPDCAGCNAKRIHWSTGQTSPQIILNSGARCMVSGVEQTFEGTGLTSPLKSCHQMLWCMQVREQSTQ